MAREDIVPLPGPPAAAASDVDSVWIVACGRLAAYDAAGGLQWEADAPAGVRGLAPAGHGRLAAAVEPGHLAWIDGRSGAVVSRQALGGDVTVAAGGGALWAIDLGAEQARRLEPDGSGAVSIAGVDRFAVDGERIWWTSRRDTLLRGGERVVDLGAGERGALAACAGSIWISTPGALLRVGKWGGELGPPVPASVEMATHMGCADGMLAGASERTLVVVDPRVDADARVFDVALGGPLGFLLATRSRVWAIAAGRVQAHVFAVRPG